MKKLILHVGTPKTGTSAIQKFLANNISALATHGIEYPMFSAHWPGIESARNGHFLFAEVMHRLDHEVAVSCPELLPQCMAQFKQFAAKLDGTMLLSDETFWQMASRYEDTVPLLKNICDEFGFDSYQVIVYMRRQDLLAESLYAQRVKGMKVASMTFDSYLASKFTHQICAYNKVIKRFEDQFGQENIHIGIYDRKLLKAGDSAADIMDVLGLDIDDPAFDRGQEETNDSIRGNYFLELKRLANTSDDYKAGDNFLMEPAIRASANFPEVEKTSLFTPEARAEFLEQYVKGNQAIARRYFDRDDLFGPQQADNLPLWQPNQDEMLRDAFVLLVEALVDERARNKELRDELADVKKRLTALEKFPLKRIFH